ncbi:MAG: BON domain-containing protein [Gammaproteobacteria bacterium]|nr:BON domain-containing protein [Gammaproteobacteria bacterium]
MEEPDRNMMRRIRKAVVDDTSLSTDAQNVKIISVNGHVTLKGPVSSSEEKRKIEAKAIAVAGKDNVANELSVK